MPSTKAFDSDFYRIEVDQDTNLLRAHWLRPVAEEEEVIRAGFSLYEALCNSGVELVLANGSNLGSLSVASKEWMSTKLYELLSRTKLKKLARVLPHTLFHRLALESVVTRAEALGTLGYQIKNFTNEEEALHWLRLPVSVATPNKL